MFIIVIIINRFKLKKKINTETKSNIYKLELERFYSLGMLLILNYIFLGFSYLHFQWCFRDYLCSHDIVRYIWKQLMDYRLVFQNLAVFRFLLDSPYVNRASSLVLFYEIGLQKKLSTLRFKLGFKRNVKPLKYWMGQLSYFTMLHI